MLDWMSEPEVRQGYRTRSFAPSSSPGLAAAALYEPLDGADDAPLVLAQHGGSSHKQGADMQAAAQALVAGCGMRMVALDGPVHGARCAADPADNPAVRDVFFALWRNEPAHVAVHVARWKGLIAELLQVLSPSRTLWYGVSMGTAYGLPVLAGETRIERALLGMWGTETTFGDGSRAAGDAAQITCKVLFQQKWDDALFTRQGQLAVFDALATQDKRLYAYPGGHLPVQGEQMADVVRFLRGD
jgi:hypothetical protein